VSAQKQPVPGLDLAVAAFYGMRVVPIRDHYPTPDNPMRWKMIDDKGFTEIEGSHAEILAWFSPDAIKQLRDGLNKWIE
jgi:hypothetical protein